MMKFETKTTKKVSKKKLTHHVYYLVDSSGSMAPFRKEVVTLLNNQINDLKKIKTNTNTFVNIATFGSSDAYNPICEDLPINKLTNIDKDSYNPQGMTPLNDCLITALYEDTLEDTYLIVLITDGCDTSSFIKTNAMSKLIKDKIATDRWTIAVACPSEYVASINKDYGIPLGSITSWDQSKEGIKALSLKVTKGTESLYRAINSGVSNIRSTYFTPELNVTKTKIKNTLTEVTNDYMRLKVLPKDNLSASSFVTGRGIKFEVGMLYYQLVKPEKVQDYKNIILMDKSNNRLYTGDEVRDLLNIPETSVNLNPTDSDKYLIFIRSTSWNRNLVNNTFVLLQKPISYLKKKK